MDLLKSINLLGKFDKERALFEILRLEGFKNTEEGLDIEFLFEVVENINDQVFDFFKKSFGVKGITSEQIENLLNKWDGDIQVFVALYGKLSGEQQTNLSKIIKAIIDGNFEEFKYGSLESLDDSDKKIVQEQLSCFDDEQLTIWKENQLSLEYLGVQERPEEKNDDLLKENNEQIFQLVGHLGDLEEVVLMGGYLEKFREIKKPADWIKFLEEQNLNLKNAIVNVINQSMIQKDIESLQKILKLSLGMFKEEFSENILNEIKNIFLRLQGEKRFKEKDGIILNAITDDPKILLEVGALTDDYSCQSYLSSEKKYLKTLPGYVMDANIKAFLTWEIPRGNKQYSQIKKMLSQNNVKYNFDFTKRILIVESGDDKVEVKLSKRVLARQIVKAGKNDNGDLAIGREKTYKSGSGLNRDLIDNFRNKLIEKWTNRMGAQNGGKINFPKSRNGVVYSDAAKGEQNDSYSAKLL